MERVFTRTLAIKKLGDEIRRNIYNTNLDESNFDCCDLGGIIGSAKLTKILAENTVVFPNNMIGFMLEEVEIFKQHQSFYLLEATAVEFIQALQKLADSQSSEEYRNHLKHLLEMGVSFVVEAENTGNLNSIHS